MSRLIIYDTSNFTDYPVGGQLTSVSNFLRYVCETQPQHTDDILLVGVTLDSCLVGKLQEIEMYGRKIKYIPVTAAAVDQSAVRHSLRLSYARGILRYGKKIRINKDDCNYIQTPEAYMPVKMLCGKAVCFVFSHGTYGRMEDRVRFFRKAPVIRRLFQDYLMSVIKGARTVFILDSDSERDYTGIAKKMIRVDNSVIPVPFIGRDAAAEGRRTECFYAGRLSKVKNVGPIIQAAEKAPAEMNLHLTVIGAGEEETYLKTLAHDRTEFTGAMTPYQVHEFMKKADILIMNSVFEGVPMTILESLSYSIPVISTDVGGIGDVLSFGTDSELTDGGADSIIAALSKIQADYGRYSRSAYDKSGRFDYRKVNGVILDELDTVLGWSTSEGQ